LYWIWSRHRGTARRGEIGRKLLGECPGGLVLRAETVSGGLGLGARHMAAAGISRDSEALAIVVSQTSGSVRVFRRGKVALELAPRSRRS